MREFEFESLNSNSRTREFASISTASRVPYLQHATHAPTAKHVEEGVAVFLAVLFDRLLRVHRQLDANLQRQGGNRLLATVS